MASARGALALAALATIALAGCDSTQEKNERAKLTAERELDSRKPTKVGKPNPDVRVVAVDAVRGKRSGAIVVKLRSRAAKPLTDLAINVGVVSAGGRRTPLNVRRNLAWFQTHVPAIAARGTATWVYAVRGAVPAGRPYAAIGAPAKPVPDAPEVAALPSIGAVVARAPAEREPREGERGAAKGEGRSVGRAKGARGRSGAPARLRVEVQNGSAVPQYGLQVYALARDGRGYTGAGKATVEHLGTGQRTTADVALAGTARGRTTVFAVPTIFE